MDDRLALLDVARQLDLEDVLGDKITVLLVIYRISTMHLCL